jgi:hypothetical protein
MEKNIIIQYQGFRRKEKGFTYDFNLHEDDIVKNPDHYQINTFTDTKEIQIQMIAVLRLQKRKFCNWCSKFS